MEMDRIDRMMDIIDFMETAPFISKQVASGEYYFLDLHPKQGTPGTVVCGGLERCTPDYRIERTRFRYHSVEYVVAGRGELGVNGKRFPLRPGMLFYYSPATPHEIATDPEQPLVKYFVDFCGPRFTRRLRRHPLSAHEPRILRSSTRIGDLFDQLQHNGRGTGLHAQAVCACLLELLLLDVAEHALSPEDAESPAQATYQRSRALIEARFLDLRTLRDIAEASHVNAPYLCRLFKRYGSEPPYQFLVRLKMRHAADLLSGPQALIKQAAKATGFTDPYHFSRVFKKVYGASPRAFLACRILQTPPLAAPRTDPSAENPAETPRRLRAVGRAKPPLPRKRLSY
jgi:AraC-like DNA-binding protein